jgi:hypothetical protein
MSVLRALFVNNVAVCNCIFIHLSFLPNGQLTKLQFERIPE